MSETLILTTPDREVPGTPEYEILDINLHRGNVRETAPMQGSTRADRSRITIQLIGSDGRMESFSYSGQDADAKLVALSKANLSVKSLPRRVFEMLQADFPERLAGAITGTPD